MSDSGGCGSCWLLFGMGWLGGMKKASENGGLWYNFQSH